MLRTLLVPCVLGLALMLPQASHAQQAATSTAKAPAPAWPAARPADVSSMNAIVKAVYAVISGPAGHKRDWNRFRSLFIPEAHLIAVHRDKQGVEHALVFTPEQFAQKAAPYMEEHGFFEREIHRKTERFGSIAQVFSTYASRNTKSDPKPFQRGINSFQLMYDGHRWWVVNIYWQAERPDLPIPKRYGG